MKTIRSNWVTVGLAVATVALASAVIAPVTDSITSEGNSVSSPPGSGGTGDVDLRMARGSGIDCLSVPDSSYEDVTVTTALIDNQSIDPSNQGDFTAAGEFLCLKNFGTDAGDLFLSVPTATSSEIGACDANESAAGDTTCNDGDAGELADRLQVGAANQGACISPSPVLMTSGNEADMGQLAPGEICDIQLFVEVHTVDDGTAATDDAVFDAAFTLNAVA